MHASLIERVYTTHVLISTGTGPVQRGPPMDAVLVKMRSLVLGILILASLFLALLLLISATLAVTDSSRSESQASPSSLFLTSDTSPNAAAVSLSKMINQFAAAVQSTDQIARSTLGAVGGAFADATSLIGRGLLNAVTGIGQTIGSGVMFVMHGIASSVVATTHIIGATANALTGTPAVSAMIRPSATAELPIINTISHSVTPLPSAEASAPPVATQPPAPSQTIWPLSGAITTLFGVPHQPYQPTHTGIDISSGNRSGATPIKPFRAGTVIDVVQSRSGLGNHITVDHGDGLTSVYAHLQRTTVTVGQIVDTTSIIGYEGSTGTSTGTHLHLEIRQNGQPQNPQNYITGHP